MYRYLYTYISICVSEGLTIAAGPLVDENAGKHSHKLQVAGSWLAVCLVGCPWLQFGSLLGVFRDPFFEGLRSSCGSWELLCSHWRALGDFMEMGSHF